MLAAQWSGARLRSRTATQRSKKGSEKVGRGSVRADFWMRIMRRSSFQWKKGQGQILAVWILATKLPNSDLNFAVDFFLLFFPRKKAWKNPPKIPRRIHPGLCSEKCPSDFCRSLFLKKGLFSEKGGGNSLNEGFGKDFYRKGNSVKRSGRFSEPPDSENWKLLSPSQKSALILGKGSQKGSEKGACCGFYNREGVLRRGSEKGVSRSA